MMKGLIFHRISLATVGFGKFGVKRTATGAKSMKRMDIERLGRAMPSIVAVGSKAPILAIAVHFMMGRLRHRLISLDDKAA